MMIQGYRIDKDTLYFYFDFSYEFAGNSVKEENILSKVLNYIKEKKIKFNGTKIVLMASGIIIGNIVFNMNDVIFNYDGMMSKMILEKQNIEVVDNNSLSSIVIDNKVSDPVIENKIEKIVPEVTNKVTSDSIKGKVVEDKEIIKQEAIEEVKTYINPVTIYRSNGEVITLELEEYLIGVVGAEMPASFNIEAIKAQAITARTYALKKISEGKKITDIESTQSYNDNSQLQNKWGSEYNKYYEKIKSAVESTKGMYMTYNGRYIDAVYHASNNGYTVSSIDVWGNDIPYLKSVESSFDINTTSYLREVTKSISEVENILGVKIDEFVINKDNTNHVLYVSVGEKSYTGIQFRNLLGLRSTDFDIEVNENIITITTRGYGHGVGMSQYGANAMANSGYNYRQILNHYYTNIVINS